MSNPIIPEFIEQANAALKKAGKESLRELFELGRMSARQPAGEWVDGKELVPGVYSAPHYSMGDIPKKIMDLLYELNLIISFRWMEWDDGRELLKDDDATKLEGQPTHILIGLLTALARNDRFCDGAWGAAVEKGAVAKLLDELEKRTNGK